MPTPPAGAHPLVESAIRHFYDIDSGIAIEEIEIFNLFQEYVPQVAGVEESTDCSLLAITKEKATKLFMVITALIAEIDSESFPLPRKPSEDMAEEAPLPEPLRMHPCWLSMTFEERFHLAFQFSVLSAFASQPVNFKRRPRGAAPQVLPPALIPPGAPAAFLRAGQCNVFAPFVAPPPERRGAVQQYFEDLGLTPDAAAAAAALETRVCRRRPSPFAEDFFALSLLSFFHSVAPADITTQGWGWRMADVVLGKPRATAKKGVAARKASKTVERAVKKREAPPKAAPTPTLAALRHRRSHSRHKPTPIHFDRLIHRRLERFEDGDFHLQLLMRRPTPCFPAPLREIVANDMRHRTDPTNEIHLKGVPVYQIHKQPLVYAAPVLGLCAPLLRDPEFLAELDATSLRWEDFWDIVGPYEEEASSAAAPLTPVTPARTPAQAAATPALDTTPHGGGAAASDGEILLAPKKRARPFSIFMLHRPDAFMKDSLFFPPPNTLEEPPPHVVVSLATLLRDQPLDATVPEPPAECADATQPDSVCTPSAAPKAPIGVSSSTFSDREKRHRQRLRRREDKGAPPKKRGPSTPTAMKAENPTKSAPAAEPAPPTPLRMSPELLAAAKDANLYVSNDLLSTVEALGLTSNIIMQPDSLSARTLLRYSGMEPPRSWPHADGEGGVGRENLIGKNVTSLRIHTPRPAAPSKEEARPSAAPRGLPIFATPGGKGPLGGKTSAKSRAKQNAYTLLLAGEDIGSGDKANVERLEQIDRQFFALPYGWDVLRKHKPSKEEHAETPPHEFFRVDHAAPAGHGMSRRDIGDYLDGFGADMPLEKAIGELQRQLRTLAAFNLTERFRAAMLLNAGRSIYGRTGVLSENATGFPRSVLGLWSEAAWRARLDPKKKIRKGMPNNLGAVLHSNKKIVRYASCIFDAPGAEPAPEGGPPPPE